VRSGVPEPAGGGSRNLASVAIAGGIVLGALLVIIRRLRSGFRLV
jgi:hypothetical protein